MEKDMKKVYKHYRQNYFNEQIATRVKDKVIKDINSKHLIHHEIKQRSMVASKFGLQSTQNNKKHHLKTLIWITTACILFIFTLPLYSPTVASIVSKILPITVTPNFSDDQYNPDLTSQLFELIEKEGYNVNSVGITPSPYTIEILLTLKSSTLKQATEHIEPKISNYLSENGYDEYTIKISEATGVPQDGRRNELSSVYDKVSEIVKEVFTKYGYAKEANYELAGVKQTWFSYIVTIDMPDHIKESNKIIMDIEKEIKSQNLNIKNIEVNFFDLEHRQQEDRWAYVTSDIYDAMSGKSNYKVTGVSYKVKNGAAYVSLKTDLDKPLSDEVIQEIKIAVREYLELPETKEQIRDDEFTIQFLLKNKKSFLKITNTSVMVK